YGACLRLPIFAASFSLRAERRYAGGFLCLRIRQPNTRSSGHTNVYDASRVLQPSRSDGVFAFDSSARSLCSVSCGKKITVYERLNIVRAKAQNCPFSSEAHHRKTGLAPRRMIPNPSFRNAKQHRHLVKSHQGSQSVL